MQRGPYLGQSVNTFNNIYLVKMVKEHISKPLALLLAEAPIKRKGNRK